MAEYICELPVEGMASFVSGSTTIPVREQIVRCIDCEWNRVVDEIYDESGDVVLLYGCTRCQIDSYPHSGFGSDPDGFCAWGERSKDA